MECPQCRHAIVEAGAHFCPQCGGVVDAGEDGDPLRLVLERAVGHQYSVERLLGRGGMGAVYLAHEAALDRMVAIKVLPPEAATEQARERFVREARIAARLNHPAIVPLYTFGELSGTMYFVMGYVEGESLEDVLRREGRLPERQCRQLLVDIARALQYAHDQGIVHRDIKPDNILLGRDGRPHLTDFGIARAATATSTLTEIGSVVGTPHYMAPEQASGERALGGASDQYALGVVAYRALTGAVPHDGDTVQQILARKLVGEPTALDLVAPDVSPRLAEAVMRTLVREPSERWPSVGALADAIEVRSYGADLPAGLENAPTATGVGVIMVTAGLVGVAWSLMGKTLRSALSIGAPEIGLAGMAILGGLIVAKTRSDGIRLGHPRDLVRRVMLRPPRWWAWRLPEWLRPLDDVWDRLPAEVVTFRDRMGWTGLVALVVFGFGVPLWAGVWAAWITLSTVPAQFARAVFASGLLAAVGLTVIPATLAILAYVQAHRGLVGRGLSPQEATEVLQTPTFGDALWDRPTIRQLLSDRAMEVASGGIPPLPSVLQALDGSGTDHADVGRVLEGAYRLRDSLEREIAVLDEDSSEEEIGRLEERLRGLGSGGEGGARQILEGRLQLARQLQARLAETRQHAEHLTRQLQSLGQRLTLGKGGGERVTPEEMHGLVRALQAAMTAAETPTAQMSPVVNDPRGGAADGIASS